MVRGVWVVVAHAHMRTPRVEVFCLSNADTYVQETLHLARSLGSKPRPKWDFFPGGPPWLGNGYFDYFDYFELEN